MTHRIGLKDVARAAGVSIGTASNAWARPESVAEATRARVLAAAAELGFAGPAPGGRLLRTGRADCVGVVTDQPLAAFFTHGYTRRLMEGVAEACAARGAGIALVSGDGVGGWSIGSALVDGFVLYCLRDGSSLIERCAARGLPMAGVDLAPHPAMATVRIDERAAAASVARRVLEGAPRRVGIVSLHTGFDDPATALGRDTVDRVRYATTRARLEGYLDAFDAAGVEVELAEAPGTAAGWEALASRWSSEADAPDVVVAMSDEIAGALRDRLPAGTTLAGFDGLEDASWPTLEQPVAEKGRLAVEAIYAPDGPRDRVLGTRLREPSPGAAPGGERAVRAGRPGPPRV